MLATVDRLVRLGAPLWAIFRVERSALQALLRAQLQIEFRRQRGVTERGTFFAKLGGGVALGVFIALALSFVPIPELWMTFAQLTILVFTSFGTLEAVPHLLVDRRSFAIIGAAPVRDLTFFVARLLEIFVVVGLVISCQAVPIFLAGLWKFPHWQTVAVFAVATALSGLLAVFVTLILYLGVLRIFPIHRAREVILFTQVGLTILLFGSFQLGPRIAGTDSFTALLDSNREIGQWLPPYYAGEWFRYALGGSDPDRQLLALAFLVPGLAGLFVLALASSGVLRRFGEDRVTDRAEEAPTRATLARPGLLDRFIAKLLRDPVERVGYDQFRRLSRRERGFRLRTYPTLALSVIFGIGYLISFTENAPLVPSPVFYAIPVYFAYLYAPIFVLQARYSDDGDAHWLLEVGPIPQPGRLIAGMGVGIALCFLVPVSLALSVGVIAVAGVSVIPHALAGVLFIIFATLFTVERVGAALPFSEAFRPQVGMTNFGLLMLTGMVQGAAVGAHFVAAMVPGGVWGLIVLYVVLSRWQLERLRRLRPREVEVRWFPGGRGRRRRLEEREASSEPS